MAAAGPDEPHAGSRFGRWYRGRPSIGGALIVLAGIEMLFSGQLDLGSIRIQVGIEGMQAMILPVALVTLGVLILTMPTHRMFYGVMTLTFSIYALVGVNLGGFFVGTFLGLVGGVMAVSWMPRRASAEFSPEASNGGAERVQADPAARRVQGHAFTIIVLAVLLGGSSAGLAAGPSFADAGVATPDPIASAPADSSPTPASDPTPAPTAGPTPSPTAPPTPEATTTPPAAAPLVSPPAALSSAVIDQDAPVVAALLARLRSASVTLQGARYIDTVTLSLADGSPRAALKITADRVVMESFSLDSTDPSARMLGTNATRVVLGGPVTLYCTSLSGSLADGTAIAFDPSTPPPLNVELLSLTTATVGLATVSSASATLTGAAMSVG